MFFKKKDQTKSYGEISTSILDYITPFMLTILTIVVVAGFFSYETIWRFFSTSILLNGMIVSLIFIAMGIAISYNVSLWRAARYLDEIDKESQKVDLSPAEIQALKNGLESDGQLFNTSQMAETIDNIGRFGALIFTDLNARLIKSKIGFRVSGARAGVNFLTGILVMLGLIGTFLGLLKTIDAVGNVLGSIGGDGGGDDMGGFIGQLAKPLQGMGLAFSSSLFGLSGSLLVGFFNHLSGGVHNNFIENISRWIDDRIPQFDPTKAGEKGKKAVPGSDDLKTWLMGFVYLANENNKKMGKLFIALAELIKQSSYAAKKTELVGDFCNRMADSVSLLNNNFMILHDQNTEFHTNLIHHVETLSARIEPLAKQSQHAEQSLAEVKNLIAQNSQVTQESGQVQKQVFSTLNAQSEALTSSLSIMAERFENQTRSLQDIASGLNGQQDLMRSIATSNQGLHQMHEAEIDLLRQIADQPVQTESIPSIMQTDILQPVVEQQSALLSEIRTLVNDLRKAQAFNIQHASPTSSTASLSAVSDPSVEMNSMMLQLNSLMEEMKQRSEGDFFDILNQLENKEDDDGESEN